MFENVEVALDEFTKKRTAYSGAALAGYLAAVALTQSILVAVAGGVVVLVVRSWAIDRILVSADMTNVEMIRQLAIANRENVESLAGEVRKLRKHMTVD